MKEIFITIIVTHAKDIIISFLKLFGCWKRLATKLDYETTINLGISVIKGADQRQFLPTCRIDWLKPGVSRDSFLSNNEVTVCFAHDPKNEDKNFFNAIYQYVQTGILPDAKNFMEMQDSISVNVVTTKIFLKNFFKRSCERLLDEEVCKFDDETLSRINQIYETEEDGFFKNIILPELDNWGQRLGSLSLPSAKSRREAKNLIDKIYAIATREKGEDTPLTIFTPNIKIAIILVAEKDKMEKQEKWRYMRRAQQLIREGYESIYVLARGETRGDFAREIADEIAQNYGIDIINKAKVDSTDFSTYFYILDVDQVNMQSNFSKFVAESYRAKEKIIGDVIKVEDAFLTIEILGVKYQLPKSRVTGEAVIDLKKYFMPTQQIELVVSTFDKETGDFSLSGLGTPSDPAKYKSLLSTGSIVDATITGFLNNDNKSYGLFAKVNDIDKEIFLHAEDLTYSRYINIADKFHIGSRINIVISYFDFLHGKYRGTLLGLRNPWENVRERYNEKQLVSCEIKEETGNGYVCEIEEGLTGFLNFREISWEHADKLQLAIGTSIPAIISKIDFANYSILLSARRVSKSPKQAYWESNQSSIIDGIVNSIKMTGIEFITNDGIKLFAPLREIAHCWISYEDLEYGFPLKQKNKLFNIKYDSVRDHLQCSLFPINKNPLSCNVGDIVKGYVVCYLHERALVIVNEEDIAYIWYGSISNRMPVNKKNIMSILPRGIELSYVVSNIKLEHNSVELSRTGRFKKCPSSDLTIDIKVSIKRDGDTCSTRSGRSSSVRTRTRDGESPGTPPAWRRAAV